MIKKPNDLGFDKIMRLGMEIVDTDVLLESLLKHEKGIEWAKLLCKIGNVEELVEILHTSKSELLAIMKYRRRLMECKQIDISFLELNTAYINKQFNKLHRLLELMFLENILDGQFKFIIDKINRKENGLQKLYDKHIEDNNSRVMSVVLIL